MNLNLAERYFDGFVTEHIIPPSVPRLIYKLCRGGRWLTAELDVLEQNFASSFILNFIHFSTLNFHELLV